MSPWKGQSRRGLRRRGICLIDLSYSSRNRILAGQESSREPLLFFRMTSRASIASFESPGPGMVLRTDGRLPIHTGVVPRPHLRRIEGCPARRRADLAGRGRIEYYRDHPRSSVPSHLIVYNTSNS